MTTFAASVSKFVELSKDRSNVVSRKIIFGVLSNVVMGSPVDTGRFRGNWQVGLAVRPSGEGPGASSDVGAVLTDGLGKIQDFVAGHSTNGLLFITNTVPYALRLEFGWSQQAPDGMVRTTMQKLDEIVAGALKK